MDVDSLARMICTVDGNHDLGAGELAERLLPMITTAIASAPAPGGEPPSPISSEAGEYGDGVQPYVVRDPNASMKQTGFRPAWIEDAKGNRLFTVSHRGNPDLARFVAAAMNAHAQQCRPVQAATIARLTVKMETLQVSRNFYARRCEALQAVQDKMRDPERKAVCDILVNGFTTAIAGAAK